MYSEVLQTRPNVQRSNVNTFYYTTPQRGMQEECGTAGEEYSFTHPREGGEILLTLNPNCATVAFALQKRDRMLIPATLFPQTARVNKDNHLEIGGCDVVALAREFGTPLYVFDDAHLRVRAREIRDT